MKEMRSGEVQRASFQQTRSEAVIQTVMVGTLLGVLASPHYCEYTRTAV